MHNNRNLLILGAGITQIPLIDTAKKMGYYVTVASMPGNYPGFSHADEVAYVNTTDKEGILTLAKEKNIAGLCTTGTDVAVCSIGYVNSTLNLQGISYESAQMATDKAKMKEALINGGVRTAKFKRVYNISEARTAANEIGYPVMFKCTDQAASTGIIKVNSDDETDKAFQYAIDNSHNPYIVIEKFIVGFEIGLDGYISKDSMVFVPHDKLTKNNGVTDVPIGHSLPYECSDSLYKDIMEQAALSCKALSLENCFINMDLMICDEKCYVIEIGGRTGATCIPDLLSLYCGYNYYEKIIENAVGKTPDMSYTPQCACSAKLLLSDKSGFLIGTDIKKCNELDGIACVLDKNIGDSVNSFKLGTDRFGHIIAAAETVEKANENIENAEKVLDVKISESSISINRLSDDNYDEIVAYLKEIDNIFPDPMSSRVDIGKHAQKVLNRGVVIAAMTKEKIIGICLGYANDSENGRAYMGTLGISEGYRSLGLGKMFLNEMLAYAQENHMKYLGLHAHKDNKRAVCFYEKNGFVLTEDNDKPYPESVYLTMQI